MASTRAALLALLFLAAYGATPALCGRHLSADSGTAAAAPSEATTRYSQQQCTWLVQCLSMVRAGARARCGCAREPAAPRLTRQGAHRPAAVRASAPERHARRHRLRLVLRRRSEQPRQRARLRLAGAPRRRSHDCEQHPALRRGRLILRV
jgi:hypothetical protein